MIRNVFVAIGMVIAMTAACVDASAKPQPLPVPLAQDLPVEVVMTQQELAVDVPNTASAVGGQFGLIGALIGAGIENAQVKKSEERVAAIRDLLIDYRFDARVEAALREKLASDGIAPYPVITVLKTPWDAAEAQNKQDMPLHAMVITPRYSMDAGFTQLTVSLLTHIVDRTIKPNGKIKTTYRFGRAYAFRFPMISASAEEKPQLWADMGATRLAELLDQGVTQATDMLVYDFSAAGRAEWVQKIKRESGTVQGQSYAGRVVRQSPEWIWVRSGNKSMQTLQGFQPLTDATAEPVATASGASPEMITEVPAVETGVETAVDTAAAVESPAAPVDGR